MAYPRSVKKKKLENEGRIHLNVSVPKPIAIHHEVAAARAPAPVRINVAEQVAKPQKPPKTVAVQGSKPPVPVRINVAEQVAKPQKPPKTVAVQGSKPPVPVHINVVQVAKPQKPPKKVAVPAVKPPKLSMPHIPQQQRPGDVGFWQILPAFLATINETVANYNSGAKGKKNLSGAAIGGVGQIIDTAKSAMTQKHPEYIPYLAAIKVNPDYESAKTQIKELKFDFDIRKRYDKYFEKNKNNIFEAIAVPPNRRESMSPAGIERVTEYLVNLGRSKGKFRTEEAAREYLNREREKVNRENDKVRQQYNISRDNIIVSNAATMLAPEADQVHRSALRNWLLNHKSNKNLWDWLNQQPKAEQDTQPNQEEIENWKGKMSASVDSWAQELQKYMLQHLQLPKEGENNVFEMQNFDEHMLGENLIPIPPPAQPERREIVPDEMPAENWQQVDDPEYGRNAVARVVAAGALRNAIDEVISGLPKALGPVYIDTELLRKFAPDIARSMSSKMGITGEDWQRYDEMVQYARNPNLVNAPVVAPQIPQLGTIKPLPISGSHPNAAPAGNEDMYVEPSKEKEPYRIGEQNQSQIRIPLGKFAEPPNAKISATDVMKYINPLPHLYTPMTYAPLPIGIDALAPRENVPIRNISTADLNNQMLKIKTATENLQRINADLIDTEKKLVTAKTEKGKLANEHTLVNMAVQLLTGVYKDDPEAVEKYYKLPKDVTLNHANDYAKLLAQKSEQFSYDIANLEKQRQEQRNSALKAQKDLYNAQLTLRMMQTGNAAKEGAAEQLKTKLFNAQQQLQLAIDAANNANDVVESAKNRYNTAEQILWDMSNTLKIKIKRKEANKVEREKYIPYYSDIKSGIDNIAKTATFANNDNFAPDEPTKNSCRVITGIKQFKSDTKATMSYNIGDEEHTMYKDAGALIRLKTRDYNSDADENDIKKYLNHLDFDGEKIYELPEDVQRARLIVYYNSDINVLLERIKTIYKGRNNIISPIQTTYNKIVNKALKILQDYKTENESLNNKALKELKLKSDMINAMYNDLKTNSSNIKSSVGKTIAEQIDIITEFQKQRDSPKGIIAKAQNDFLDAEAGQPQLVQSEGNSEVPIRLLVPQQMLASQPNLQQPNLQQPNLQQLQSLNPEMAAALEVIDHPRIPQWLKNTLATMVGLGVLITTGLAITKNYDDILKMKKRINEWFDNEGKKKIGEEYNQVKEGVDKIIENVRKNIKTDDIQKRVSTEIAPLAEKAKSVADIDIENFTKSIEKNTKNYKLPNLSMSNISSLVDQQGQEQGQDQPASGLWRRIGNYATSYATSGADKFNSIFFPLPENVKNSEYPVPPELREYLLSQEQTNDQRNSIKSYIGSIGSYIQSSISSLWKSSQQETPQMFARKADNKNFDGEDEDNKNFDGEDEDKKVNEKHK